MPSRGEKWHFFATGKLTNYSTRKRLLCSSASGNKEANQRSTQINHCDLKILKHDSRAKMTALNRFHWKWRQTSLKREKRAIISRRISENVMLALVMVVLCCLVATSATTLGAGSELTALGGQLGQSVRLPCLIGRQFNCGEPYFIAWYKMSPTRPLAGWTRIEYSTNQSKMQESESGEEASGARSSSSSSSYFASTQVSNSTNQRFSFYRGQAASSCLGDSSMASQKHLATELECAQLEITKLELGDEGQYKCEITFSESLEVDKCPPSSISRLTVIGKFQDCNLVY